MNHGYSEVFETKQLLYLQDIIITSISLLDITPRTVHRNSQKHEMDQFSTNKNMPVFQLKEKIKISNIQQDNNCAKQRSVMKPGQECILETEHLIRNI